MNRSLGFALLLVSFAGGCVAPAGPSGGSDPVASASAPIVGGEVGGPDAVVVLQNLRNGGLCSGTLIAERVVLTAKHCVQEPFAEDHIDESQIIVGVGDSANSTSVVLRVAHIITTPGVYTEDARGSVNDTLIGKDVAVMVLESGTPSVEPIPIRRESHVSLAGQTITACGFGQTPSGRAGIKYVATGTITDTDERLLYTGALTCQGDSGGPAITADNQVAGVVSFGAGSCGSGYGAYNAIFPFLDLIDMALTEAGTCLNNGAEQCDGADNDCDDLVDEDCIPLGGACTADAECLGTTCRNTSAGQICTSPCDPLRPNIGCAPGSYCSRFEGGCEGYCVPMVGDANLPDGAACTHDAECASLYCADPGDGTVRCLQPCRGDQGMCLAGDVCAVPAGVCGGCVPAGLVAGARGLGEECEDDLECGSGDCLEDAGRSYCTRACAADTQCPSGYHCRDRSVCVAGPRGDLGDRCLVNGDCLDGLFCAAQRGNTWCSRQCFDSEPCPDGFDCVPAGGTTVCAPNLGLVGDECTSDSDCLTELCGTEGPSAGSCTRHCGADAPCAPGYECRREEDGTTAVCVTPSPPSAGGCSVGARSSSVPGATWFFGLAAAALSVGRLAWRRRR